MPFSNVFGGSPVQPSDVQFRAVTLSQDTDLFWPISGYDTDDVVARIMHVRATSTNLSLTLPDATIVSPGQDTLIKNVLANSFTVKDATGGTIITIASGESYYLYLTGNSTVAGTWTSLLFGSSTSTANSASLAGAGLEAVSTLLQQDYSFTTLNTTYAASQNDRASVLLWTGGVGAINFAQASSLEDGWFCFVSNQGSGTLTLTPNGSETIDGAATKVLAQTESCGVYSDGLNLYTIGYGRAVTSSFTRLVKSVAGNTDVTLTSTEAANQMLEFTGTLTGNINVITPNTVARYYTYNNTSGAFTLTLKTSAGTGILVPQGNRDLLNCDGTNIVRAISTTSGTVTSVGTSSDLTGGPITTTGTIGLANTAVSAGAYGSSTNVSTFNVDTKGRLTLAGQTPYAGSTETVAGVAEIATQAEVTAALLDDKIITPLKLKSWPANLTTVSLDLGDRAVIADASDSFNPKTTLLSNILGFALRRYISGLITSNSVGDVNNDVSISTGVATDQSNTVLMSLGSALTKRLDALWVVGNNNGGLSSGAKAANTWYHYYLIRRSDTGVVDALFDTSATSPTLPANYDQFRRIGAVLTNASSNIEQFVQTEKYFWWKDPGLDHSGVILSATPVTVRAPLGVQTLAYLNTAVNGVNNNALYASPLSTTDLAPSQTAAPLGHTNTSVSTGSILNVEERLGPLLTDTSSQIRFRNINSVTVRVSTLGYYDFLGTDS